MKKLLALLLVATVAQTGCMEDSLCLIGSGVTNQYSLNVQSFDRIALSGPVNLNFTQGAERSVSVIAEPEMWAALEYDVTNGTLDIGYDNVSCFSTNYGVQINITSPYIKDIDHSGAGAVRTLGDIDLDDLKIYTSGDIDVRLTGRVGRLTIDSEGSVNVQNYGLQTDYTVLRLQGSAITQVNCSEQLYIDLDGYARVEYKGQPQISQKVSGDLDLVNAN